MKFLNVLLTFGTGSLVASFPLMNHTTSQRSVIEIRDIKDLYRRAGGEKHASPASRPTKGDATGQNPSTRLRGTSPQPTRNSPPQPTRNSPPQPARNSPPRSTGISPPRSTDTSPPRGRERLPSIASSSRTSTTQSVSSGRERANVRPDAARSLFPSSPPRPSFERINPYVAMLGAGKATIPHSIGRTGLPPASSMYLRDAQTAKREAREARDFANRRLIEAKVISDTKRANSPGTKNAMQDSLEASHFAVQATRHAANQQINAGISLIGTSEHHTVDGHFESAARKTARAEQRHSYNLAFDAEHKARQQVEDARGYPIGREKFNAIQRAAYQQKGARQWADVYYRDHEDYRQIKSQIPGDSSSSDEERELSDYPKTWRAPRTMGN